MNRTQTLACTLFAVGLAGLGVLALVYGDFALGWQPVPQGLPARQAVAYASGVLMLLLAAGLLFRATLAWTTRILLLYLLLWAALKVPAIFVAPKIEGVWLGLGELTALLAGGWTLYARLSGLPSRLATGPRAVTAARILFAVSLVPIGISHLFYTPQTVVLIPHWLPFRHALAISTGIAQAACGVCILAHVIPRIAATVEAILISLFTILVWATATAAAPATRLPWTAFFISWIIAAAAWTVALNFGASSASAEERQT
ncbi:MAG TPA: DoxX family protein [Terracidiphilus sp.]|nr:DoxX family protein [Terracidiphilus sp.]